MQLQDLLHTPRRATFLGRSVKIVLARIHADKHRVLFLDSRVLSFAHRQRVSPYASTLWLCSLSPSPNMALLPTSGLVSISIFFGKLAFLIPLDVQVRRRMKGAGLPLGRFSSSFEQRRMWQNLHKSEIVWSEAQFA
jgi:hypothetical protein